MSIDVAQYDDLSLDVGRNAGVIKQLTVGLDTFKTKKTDLREIKAQITIIQRLLLNVRHLMRTQGFVFDRQNDEPLLPTPRNQDVGKSDQQQLIIHREVRHQLLNQLYLLQQDAKMQIEREVQRRINELRSEAASMNGDLLFTLDRLRGLRGVNTRNARAEKSELRDQRRALQLQIDELEATIRAANDGDSATLARFIVKIGDENIDGRTLQNTLDDQVKFARTNVEKSLQNTMPLIVPGVQDEPEEGTDEIDNSANEDNEEMNENQASKIAVESEPIEELIPQGMSKRQWNKQKKRRQKEEEKGLTGKRLKKDKAKRELRAKQTRKAKKLAEEEAEAAKRRDRKNAAFLAGEGNAPVIGSILKALEFDLWKKHVDAVAEHLGIAHSLELKQMAYQYFDTHLQDATGAQDGVDMPANAPMLRERMNEILTVSSSVVNNRNPNMEDKSGIFYRGLKAACCIEAKRILGIINREQTIEPGIVLPRFAHADPRLAREIFKQQDQHVTIKRIDSKDDVIGPAEDMIFTAFQSTAAATGPFRQSVLSFALANETGDEPEVREAARLFGDIVEAKERKIVMALQKPEDPMDQIAALTSYTELHKLLIGRLGNTQLDQFAFAIRMHQAAVELNQLVVKYRES